jgi:bacterioferritin (cytochrome b1)
MKTTETNDACIRICNSLLRGELSAVETYSLAINRYTGKPAVTELQKIRTEHALSAARLSQNVREMGGTPDEESGAWGVFAKVVQGAANLFGEESALESLKKGEEKGKSDYEAALEGEEMMSSHKEIVRSELLPRINHHIAALDRLEKLA